MSLALNNWAQVAQLDACPAGNQEVTGSTSLGRKHSFEEILS